MESSISLCPVLILILLDYINLVDKHIKYLYSSNYLHSKNN